MERLGIGPFHSFRVSPIWPGNMQMEADYSSLWSAETYRIPDHHMTWLQILRGLAWARNEDKG